MRTTVTIDDDVLASVRELANHQRTTVGAVLSDLARNSLTRKVLRRANGIPMIPVTNPDAVITMEHVNMLRDELP